MLWDVVKPGPDVDSRSLSQPLFKQKATRQCVGGKMSKLGAKGRKARAKENNEPIYKIDTM